MDELDEDPIVEYIFRLREEMELPELQNAITQIIDLANSFTDNELQGFSLARSLVWSKGIVEGRFAFIANMSREDIEMVVNKLKNLCSFVKEINDNEYFEWAEKVSRWFRCLLNIDSDWTIDLILNLLGFQTH